MAYPFGDQPFRLSAGLQAIRIKAGTQSDKGRGREALEREAYLKNASSVAAEPAGPGTSGLALFDEVAP